MSATSVWRAVLISILLSPFAAAQATPSSTTTCTLDDGRQVYVRYNAVSSKNDKPQNGKAWAPGGAPMQLFTEAQLTFGNSVIPIGAYTVYVIPAKDKWALAVNKTVTPGAPYDEKQDIAHAEMETEKVDVASEALEVAFAHVGTKCTLRIYVGKVASFADFTAK